MNKPVGKVVTARKAFRCVGAGAVRYHEWHTVPAASPSFVFRRECIEDGMRWRSGDRICIEHARKMGAEIPEGRTS